MKIFEQTLVTLNLSVEAPPLPMAKDPNVSYIHADNFYRNAVITPYIRRAMASARGDVDADGKPSSAAKFGWMRRWVQSWRS